MIGGMIRGVRIKASIRDLLGLFNRDKPIAAEVPSAKERETAMPATCIEERKAAPHLGTSSRFSNQSKVKALGGNRMNGEALTLIGKTTMIGATKNRAAADAQTKNIIR